MYIKDYLYRLSHCIGEFTISIISVIKYLVQLEIMFMKCYAPPHIDAGRQRALRYNINNRGNQLFGPLFMRPLPFAIMQNVSNTIWLGLLSTETFDSWCNHTRFEKVSLRKEYSQLMYNLQRFKERQFIQNWIQTA